METMDSHPKDPLRLDEYFHATSLIKASRGKTTRSLSMTHSAVSFWVPRPARVDGHAQANYWLNTLTIIQGPPRAGKGEISGPG